jgi:hypothetical protein
MARSDDKPTSDREAGEKLAPTNDLLRTIEAYAAELRQIVQNLRKRLH